jgi:hypothetical protein
MIELDRKADARRKIQLGGLIIKSGLGEEKAALLYGMLLEAKELLDEQGNEIRLRWQIRGELSFKE